MKPSNIFPSPAPPSVFSVAPLDVPPQIVASFQATNVKHMSRHPCGAFLVVCAFLAVIGSSAFGFHVTVTSSSSSGRNERGASRRSSPGRIQQAPHSASVAPCDSHDWRLRRRGLLLLSERGDSSGGGVQEQEVAVRSCCNTRPCFWVQHDRKPRGSKYIM